MSTRCQVIVKDKYGQEQWFYRHSDGYPEGVAPSLSRSAALDFFANEQNHVASNTFYTQMTRARERIGYEDVSHISTKEIEESLRKKYATKRKLSTITRGGRA